MCSYFQTPNVNIPLNKRAPGEVAAIAWQQLKPFQDAAPTWPVFQDGPCNRCRLCTQNIWSTYDPLGKRFQYGDGEVIALIVAHIRQAHAEVVTNDGTKEHDAAILVAPGNGHPGSVSSRDADRPGD